MAIQNAFTGIINDPGQYSAGSPIIQGMEVYVPYATVMNATTPRTLDFTMGKHQSLLLDINTTLVLPVPLGSFYFYLRVQQDAGGGHTLAWPAATRFVADTAPVITVGASAIDILLVYTDGTNWYVNVFAQNLSH